jgi:putative peptide zinc metalloprotease protein
MVAEPQRVALPALLRQGLLAYREVQGDQQKYKIRDNWKGQTYQFEHWQFFVLEVLPVCEDFRKLASIFEDRFGRALTKQDVEGLFSFITEIKLFGPSAESHSMVAEFMKKKGMYLSVGIPSQKRADTKGTDESLPNTEDIWSSAKKTPSAGFPDEMVSNSADFTVDEFKKQKKDIRRLCQKIKNERYELGKMQAPEDSVQWLNGILEMPDLYEQISAKRPNLSVTDEIKKLKEQTEKSRKAAFKDLKIEEQNAIRGMNRALLELVYAHEAPKVAVLDEAAHDRLSWHLFNPGPLIRRIHPFVLPLKYSVYLIPAILAIALIVAFRHADIMKADFEQFLMGMKDVRFRFIAETLTGLVASNLIATIVFALVAYSFRATVNSFYVQFHFGFYPRVHVRIGNRKQLSRREVIWLHASPLLARLGVLSVSIMLWYGTRNSHDLVSHFALTLTAIMAASLFIVANPLIKSSGYDLMTAVLNEPQLRSKAALALVNRFRRGVYQKVDNNILVAYSLASTLFMIATVSLFVYMFGAYVQLHFGGTWVFLVTGIIAVMALRLNRKIRDISEIYDRAVQFDRWRSRALPKLDDDGAGTEKTKSFSRAYVSPAFALLLVAVLFVPYHYELGGDFIILPNLKKELTSENAAILDKVYFDGGEFVKEGTVVAELSTTDYQGQVKIYDAKIREQQAVVNDLKTRPKPEEVRVAERLLDVRKRQETFSGKKLDRFEKLYKEGTISLEEIEDQRKQYEVDAEQVKEALANLELVKAGVTSEKIAAAEAKRESYEEERSYYNEKINQSIISMPFDGRLEGVNLKQKIGHYLNKGELFAIAEKTDQVLAEIEVPEADIGHIAKSAAVRVRPLSYSDTDFNGVVTSIDSAVTEKSSGRVVKVVTLIDNKDGRLKSGMTGYAKIISEEMPVWKVSSQSTVRFVQTEVWSWIP